MTWLEKYLVGIICACMVAALAKRLLSVSLHFSKIGNVIVGLFVVFCAISPLVTIDWNDNPGLLDFITDDFAEISQDAQTYQHEALRQRIKEEAQAYVWNKANALSMQVEFEIVLADEYPFEPCAIHITGKVSPYAKSQFTTYLSEQLGIPKEAQMWNTKNS